MAAGRGATAPAAAPLELLARFVEELPDVFADSVLPRLQQRHLAALAAASAALRALVQARAGRTLTLEAGRCCLSHLHDELASRLPNVTDVALRPGNLHEAMYTLPIFLMTSGGRLAGVTALDFQDLLPDRPPERVQCSSCTAWTATYDLSAILALAAASLPQLRRLAFATHFISDAETAAIGAMTRLTSLTLRSTHGVKLAGLARLQRLADLQELLLMDATGRGHPADISFVLSRPRLARLSLGYRPAMTPALLASLAELVVAGEGDGGGGKGGGGGGGVRQTAAAPPPPLVDLSFHIAPFMGGGLRAALAAAAQLTGLTRLSVGWLVRTQDDALARGIPTAAQRAVTQLHRLRSLGLGWRASHELLAALAALTELEELQLGGLPPAFAPPHARLPSVLRLTAHLPERPRLLPLLNPAVGAAADAAADAALDGLGAFPNATRLELTGCVVGRALPRLSLVPHLRELLLPHRLSRCSCAQLAALAQLRELTSLRVGWRAGSHDGPASLVEDGDDDGAAGAAEDGAPAGAGAAAAGGGGDAAGGGAAAGDAGPAAAAPGGEAAAAEAAAAGPEPPLSLRALAGATQLRSLEVVGPLQRWELADAAALPRVTRLALRNNTAWSSGLPVDELVALPGLFGPLRLQKLELLGCGGLDECSLQQQPQQQQQLQQQQQRDGGSSTSERVAAVEAAALAACPLCDVVVRGAAGAVLSASALGRGYQGFGAVLTREEDDGPRAAAGAAAEAAAVGAEALADEGGGGGGPLPPGAHLNWGIPLGPAPAAGLFGGLPGGAGGLFQLLLQGGALPNVGVFDDGDDDGGGGGFAAGDDGEAAFGGDAGEAAFADDGGPLLAEGALHADEEEDGEGVV